MSAYGDKWHGCDALCVMVDLVSKKGRRYYQPWPLTSITVLERAEYNPAT